MPLLLLVLLSRAALAAEPALPPPAQRAAMLSAVASEMARLDGEGLVVRDRNRARSFPETAKLLAEEAGAAASWPALMRAFARLDAAYPNLHARFAPGQWFRYRRARLVPSFGAEISASERVSWRLRGGEHDGASLVAINGRAVENWAAENLEHCKFPLRSQCDAELFEGLRRELLSWTRAEPLAYTAEKDGLRFEVPVTVSDAPQSSPDSEPLCSADAALYEGFTPAHLGRFACLFTKNSDPSTVVLRISSFSYYGGDKHPIDSPAAEVDALWPWWRKHAPGIRHLILDLAGNHGGNEPTPWYEILFERPYQEQWVVFRKLPELLDDSLRRQGLFWGTPQQEVWFQNLRRDGTWERTAWGAFLPPVPMFCAGEERSDCREGLFPVRRHGFTGRVTLILNRWCVSSCDGFAYEVKEQLGARVRVVGQHQAADTAYSRAMIGLHLDPSSPGGFRTIVGSHRGDGNSAAVLSQTVAVTRSVLEDGTVVSGLPLPMDEFLAWPFGQEERAWRADAVKKLR